MSTERMRDRYNSRHRRARPSRPAGGSAGGGVNLGSVASRIFYWLAWLLTLPIRVVMWLTQPPGSAILFGLAVLYFIGLSCEGYLQAARPDAPSFIVKPFIEDGADPLVVFAALLSPVFWVASVLSTVVQAIQATVLRDISLMQAQREYEEVKGYSVPEKRPDAVDLVEFKRRQLKRAGTKSLRVKGFVCLLAYAIDFIIAFTNFPLLGNDGIGELLRNLTWIALSIFGAEFAIALFLDALDKGREAAAPKVEVVD
jgi:Flp pilus assembly protein TadB